MAQSDPSEHFSIRVHWDGRSVAGISKLGPLKRSTEVLEHHDGGDPSTSRKLPGSTTYEPIVLERGLTHDRDFDDWATRVMDAGSGAGEGSALGDFRKDLVIELFNEAGQVVLAYVVHRAWVSEYTAVPELDANANVVAFESIKLEHEGWERDRNRPAPSGSTPTIE